MTRTAFLAISAIAALGATCLGASAFDRDGRDPAVRSGSRPAAGGGQATSIEVGRTSVGVAGGNGTAVVVGGSAVSVGGGKGSGVVVGGSMGSGVAVGGDGTSVVVGGTGVSVGGRGTGVVVDGTSVVVGGNGAAVGIGGAGVVVAPGSGPRVVTQIPGFKAMALGWNSGGAWVVRTSPSLEAASADALQICNSQFGECTLSDARVAPTAFGCLAVAQSDDADRVFAAAGNSPDAARAAVSTQVTSAGLHGHLAYAACNY